MSNHSYKCKNGEKVCRLCLKNEKFKISLLCTYAQQEHILPRIEKYLQIKIPTEEKSSKYICYDCFSNLKFIERSVSLAQQNQKYFEHSQQSSENNIFDDESLHTPTEITEPEMSANFINRKKNVTFTYAEEDSQQLFKPTVKTAAVKTGNKRFPFKNGKRNKNKLDL